jgi:hypothetical protein
LFAFCSQDLRGASRVWSCPGMPVPPRRLGIDRGRGEGRRPCGREAYDFSRLNSTGSNRTCPLGAERAPAKGARPAEATIQVPLLS